jgi:hypothetical protein
MEVLKEEGARITICMPRELKAWVENRAKENWTSMSQEIVRTIKARMEAEQRA